MFYSVHFIEHENSATAPEIFCTVKSISAYFIYIMHVIHLVIIDTDIIQKSKQMYDWFSVTFHFKN